VPMTNNQPSVNQRPLVREDQLTELRDGLSQELVSIRASVVDSLSQVVQLQGETLQAQLIELVGQSNLAISREEVDEEKRSKELSDKIAGLLKKEVQTTLVPALARIVMHTTENSLLKPVQNTLSTELEPRLEKTLRTSVQNAVQSISKQLQKQLFDNTDRLIQGVVEGSSRPVHNEFKKAFQDLLIPAFQKATNKMFAQINDALIEGLSSCPAMGPVEVQGITELKREVGALTGSVAELAHAVTHVTGQVQRLQGQVTSLVKSMQTLAEEQAKATQVAQAAAEAASQAVAAVAAQQAHAQQQAVTRKALPEEFKVVDPKIHLQELMDQEKFEQACTEALGVKNVEVLLWVLENLDKERILGTDPPLLSQPLLLCLLQQVGYDLENQTTLKLDWLREIALVFNPLDGDVNQHAPQVLSQLKENIEKLKPVLAGSVELTNLKLLAHIVNSHVSSCI